jgi:hypothetical protein
VSVFRNLAESLTASRVPECFHEADEKTLPRFGRHWFINIGGELANNPISHPVSPFRRSVKQKRGGRGVRVGGKLARYSCLTGGKLEENPDFSLRQGHFSLKGAFASAATPNWHRGGSKIGSGRAKPTVNEVRPSL